MERGFERENANARQSGIYGRFILKTVMILLCYDTALSAAPTL